MRILIVSPGRLPVPACKGGAVETLIDLLIEYNERHGEHEIYVASVWNVAAEMMSHSYVHTKFMYIKQSRLISFISDHHLIPFRTLDYFFSKKVLKILFQKNISFDCIVIQNELVNGYVLRQKNKGHYIYHAHNDTIIENNEKDQSFLRACDKVITVSEFLSEKLREKAKLHNTEVVYNGIDTKLFEKKSYQVSAAQKRVDYNISETEFVIAFAGRLVEEKGMQVLVEALDLIPQEYPVVLLVIGASFFGENKETIYIRKLKEACDRSRHRIIFTGYVKHTEMPAYYAMADISCVPSLWDEPFGLTVAEQMSMELPVITTDSGAIPEIMDSSCGYIFPRDNELSKRIASAVIELRQDAYMRRKMGKKARRIIEERFSCDVFCENWFKSVQIGDQE